MDKHTASSKNSNGGSFKIRRETARRCFSPPEIIIPRSPTIVLYPSGKLEIVS